MNLKPLLIKQKTITVLFNLTLTKRQRLLNTEDLIKQLVLLVALTSYLLWCLMILTLLPLAVLVLSYAS